MFDRVKGLAISEPAFRRDYEIRDSRQPVLGHQNPAGAGGDSGSRNAKGRNNTTGGILIEEGSSDFEVRDCTFRRIRGNALWTHSLYTSPRLHDGVFARESFRHHRPRRDPGGHATQCAWRITPAQHIGFPLETVDVENGGMPVALDTAGNVDHSIYPRNNSRRSTESASIWTDSTTATCATTPASTAALAGLSVRALRDRDEQHRSRHALGEHRDQGNVIDGTKYGGLFLMGSGHRVRATVSASEHGGMQRKRGAIRLHL